MKLSRVWLSLLTASVCLTPALLSGDLDGVENLSGNRGVQVLSGVEGGNKVRVVGNVRHNAHFDLAVVGS